MTKKYFLILILTITGLLTSCDKVNTSENQTLYGNWVEESILLDREGLFFDETDTLFYATRSPSRYIGMVKYLYSLDKRHKSLDLWRVDDPSHRKIRCNISLNHDETELTITGLNEESPDQTQKFKRSEK
jgi:hypothetical protein